MKQMIQRFTRWIGAKPIVMKLTMAAVTTTAIAVAMAVWLLFSSSRELLTADAIDSMREAMSRQVERLNRSIYQTRQDVTLLSQSDSVRGILRAYANTGFDSEMNTTEEVWREQIENTFAFMLESKGYQQIRLIALGDSGREIVRVDGPKRPGGNVVIRCEPELGENIHREFIGHARKLVNGQVHVSQINLRREHGGLEVPWRPTQRFVAPVFMGGVGRAGTENEALETIELAGKMRSIDEILTTSALAAAQSNELEWEDRYRKNELLLEQALSRAVAISDDSTGQVVASINTAYRALAEIEQRSFDLVREGRSDEAAKLLEGVEYASLKRNYAKELEHLLGRLEQTNNPRLAVAVVVINTDALLSVEESSSVEHFGMILANETGGVLRHPDPERAWGFELGNKNGLDQEYPAAWRVLIEGEDSVVWDEGHRETHVVGRVPLDEKGNRFLAIVMTVCEDTVLARVADLRLKTVAVSLLAILLAGGLCALSLNRLMRPILSLTVQADELSSGNTKVRLTASGNDEVGRLGSALAKLVEKLQKSTEEARQAKEYTDNIIKSIIDMLVVVAPDGKIVTVNEATCEALGYREDELIGGHASLLFSEDEDEDDDDDDDDDARLVISQEALPFKRAGLRGLAKDGAICNIEKTLRTKSNHTLPVLMSGSVIRNDDGTIRGVVCVAHDITGRKRAEEAQRDVEAQLRILIETLPDLVWLKDTNGIYLACNRKFERLYGARQSEIIGNSDYDFVDKDLADFFREKDQAAIAAGKPCVNEEEVTYAVDGHKELLETIKTPMLDCHGRIFGVLGIARDITERKRMEEALRESEEKFKSISASAQDAIIMMDGDGDISYWNEAAEVIFGYTREEVLGRNLHVAGFIVPDRFHEAHKQAWPRFQKHGKGVAVGKTTEVVALRKNGQEFPVEFSLSAVMIKKRWHAIGMMRDITERKTAEERLRKLSVAVEQSPASIVITDTKGTIEYVNPRFTEVTGYTSGEAIGQNPRILKSGKWPKKAYEALWNRILAGETWTGEFENKKKNGELYWETASIRPIRNEDGSITHFLAVKQDISKQKGIEASLRRTESELREHRDHLEELVSERTADLAKTNEFLVHQVEERRAAEKAAAAASSAKGDFLATMSHELRTPLNGIIGMTELLLGSGLTHEQKKQAGLVKASGDILLRLINDILDFSKIEAGRLELEITDFNLRDSVGCVAALLGPQAARKGLELTVVVNPSVPAAVRGDPGRLQQVMTNLLSNAIKFTQHGQIDIRVVVDKGDESSVTVRISVTDTGIGIPADKQDSLFQSFSQLDASYSRRFGGTGLGLAISKRLVEMMGGEIGAVCGTGTGSTFWFSVTLQKGVEAARPLVIPDDYRRIRVLAVDDNATNRAVLDEQLTRIGILHELASDGEKALTALRGAATTETPFALVLVDLQMPDMDGEQFAQAVKCDPNIRDTVLLLLTSVGIIGDEEQMKSVGFSAWLPKPIRQSQLLDAITQALASARVEVHREINETLDSNQSLSRRLRTTETKILAAEDNEIGQEVLRQVLTQAGYAYEIVTNGRQALDAWCNGDFDLILMDCQMPEMDGFTATREIRRIERRNAQAASTPPRTPILALTANALKGDRENCLDAGMDDHIAKPFEPAQLIEAIESHLVVMEKKEMAFLHSESSDQVNNDPTSVSQSGDCADDNTIPFDMGAVLKRWGGDKDFAQKLIDKFLAAAPSELAQLTQRITTGDVAETTRLAHGLKGAAAYCGAERFREVAARLEEIGRAGDLNGVGETLEELSRELERCLKHTPTSDCSNGDSVSSNH